MTAGEDGQAVGSHIPRSFGGSRSDYVPGRWPEVGFTCVSRAIGFCPGAVVRPAR